MSLQRTATAAWRLLEDEVSLKQGVSDLVRDAAAADPAARTLSERLDWLATYEKDREGTYEAARSALNSIYQQIHIIRRGSLPRLVGSDWLDEVAGRSSYGWFIGRRDDKSRSSADRAARALAWLDRAAACRNKVVQHRSAGVTPRFVVLPWALCEVYWTKAPRLADVAHYYQSVLPNYGHPIGDPRSPASVAYVASIAEELRSLDPPANDLMSRAVRSSSVYVLVGSAAFVQNLDQALVCILEERSIDAS